MRVTCDVLQMGIVGNLSKKKGQVLVQDVRIRFL